MPERLGDALNLLAQVRGGHILGEQRLEQREGRAQAPQSHAQLVQSLRVVVVEEHVLVQAQVPEAGLCNGLERLAGTARLREADRRRLARAPQGAVDQAEAARALGEGTQAQRNGLGERLREGEEILGLARLQFELQFPQGRVPIGRLDPALVEGDLDAGGAVTHDAGAALNQGGEGGVQARVGHAREESRHRRLGKLCEIRLIAADRPLPFRPVEQADPLGRRLDRLDEAIAVAADAQGQARLPQVSGGGVEIGGGQEG